jgi:hypothetical protein
MREIASVQRPEFDSLKPSAKPREHDRLDLNKRGMAP